MSLIYHPTGNYQFAPGATAPRIVGAAGQRAGEILLYAFSYTAPARELAHGRGAEADSAAGDDRRSVGQVHKSS